MNRCVLDKSKLTQCHVLRRAYFSDLSLLLLLFLENISKKLFRHGKKSSVPKYSIIVPGQQTHQFE